MKLQTAYSTEDVESVGAEKSIAFDFDQNSKEMMFAMFTKNIYSNPIGSIVREISANCFDSHKEAGVNDAVVLRLIKENNQNYIEFNDVGVGMSPERIETVYAKYFSTTKRGSNDQIGGFGIGGKTPLAYTDSFFVITRFAGVKYIYNIYKGQKSPIIDLFAKENTTERNGTTVKIPIKPNDVYSFEREITRQLYYFENIVFEGFSHAVSNKYQIFTGKNFLYRGSDYTSNMHICLGRVAYPIDFSALNIDFRENQIPIALRFDIGELNVGASRESLEYSDFTKKAIIKKMADAKAELKAMLVAQHKSVTTLEQYYEVKSAFGSLYLDKTKTISIDLRSIVKHDPLVLPKYKHIIIPSSYSLLTSLLNVKHVGTSGGKRNRSNVWDFDVLDMKKYGNLYFIPQGTSRKKRVQSWLKHHHEYYTSIHPKELDEFRMKGILKDLFLKDVYGKDIPSTPEIEKEAKVLIEEILSLVQKYSTQYQDIKVPEDYVIPKKNAFDHTLLEKTIPLRSINTYASQSSAIFGDLVDFKGTIVYGTKEFEPTMIEYARISRELGFNRDHHKRIYFLGSNRMIKFIVLSKTNVLLMKYVKRAIPHTEFAKRFLLKKRDVAVKILAGNKFLEKYNEINNLWLSKTLSAVDSKLRLHVAALQKQYKSLETLKNKEVEVNKEFFNIDETKILTGFEKSFSYIDSQSKKNGMLDFINIPSTRYDGDGAKNPELMKLLQLVYVK